MNKPKKDCAFQYYTTGYDSKMVEDVTGITIDEAKALFNKHYPQMIARAKSKLEFEVAIWVDMAHDSDYQKTLIYLINPGYESGQLTETTTKYFGKFKNQ